MGFACIHVAIAIDSGADVGFFWSDDEEMDRPWAWCAECEALLKRTGSDWAALRDAADFKVLCAMCWDTAKHVLFDDRRRR
jgi:hypothetical protein